VKKAIEIVENTYYWLKSITFGGGYEVGYAREVKDLLGEALAELKAPPRWYAPEQWKGRTGEEWPDDWPVYLRAQYTTEGWGEWHVVAYSVAKREKYEKQIACFTEAGAPPDDWEPEEGR
jgi:hypothetical protein